VLNALGAGMLVGPLTASWLQRATIRADAAATRF
jgi:hypothetical protein